MKIGYYPGCSLHSTAVEFDMSTKQVCRALDVQLDEIKDWICCGSSPAHQCDELMSVALPAKNIALAKETGLREICAPCASCYSRLKFAQQRMTDPKMRADVEQVIESKYPEGIEVLNILDFVTDKVGLDVLENRIVHKLKNMRLACYYGCLLTRPPKVTGTKDFENPTQMEDIIEAIGSDAVDWNFKTSCCGAAFALTKTDVVLELTRKILLDAAKCGAQAIAVACPLCHSNLDARQEQINEKYDTNFNIPIFYITELMGLALGIEAKKLGVLKHITSVKEFLKERNLL